MMASHDEHDLAHNQPIARNNKKLRGKSDATQWAMEYFKKEYFIF
jgi:hypothetical protein